VSDTSHYSLLRTRQPEVRVVELRTSHCDVWFTFMSGFVNPGAGLQHVKTNEIQTAYNVFTNNSALLIKINTQFQYSAYSPNADDQDICRIFCMGVKPDLLL